MRIFEVTSKSGRKLRLTEIQWAHISHKHPELNNQLQKMISVSEAPDFIYYSSKDDCYQYILMSSMWDSCVLTMTQLDAYFYRVGISAEGGLLFDMPYSDSDTIR